MKKIFTILIGNTLFLLAQETCFAQDSSKSNAIKHVNETSEQADKLYGKKIQQQSLTIKPIEKMDTLATTKPARKKCVKHKRKRR
ncbi:MAG: hypothetical protein ABI594_08905 [Ginsengibacter sp.]